MNTTISLAYRLAGKAKGGMSPFGEEREQYDMSL